MAPVFSKILYLSFERASKLLNKLARVQTRSRVWYLRGPREEAVVGIAFCRQTDRRQRHHCLVKVRTWTAARPKAYSCFTYFGSVLAPSIQAHHCRHSLPSYGPLRLKKILHYSKMKSSMRIIDTYGSRNHYSKMNVKDLDGFPGQSFYLRRS